MLWQGTGSLHSRAHEGDGQWNKHMVLKVKKQLYNSPEFCPQAVSNQYSAVASEFGVIHKYLQCKINFLLFYCLVGQKVLFSDWSIIFDIGTKIMSHTFFLFLQCPT